MRVVPHAVLLSGIALTLTIALPAPALAASPEPSFSDLAAREFAPRNSALSFGEDDDRPHARDPDHPPHFERGDDDGVRTSPVPEPGTWAMMLAGAVGVAVVARRRKSRG